MAVTQFHLKQKKIVGSLQYVRAGFYCIDISGNGINQSVPGDPLLWECDCNVARKCDIPFDAIVHIPISDAVYHGTVYHDCDANWKSSNGKGCKTYEAENYCKKDGDHYGSGWSYHSWGTFERYADSAGRTPLVCPECGCNGGVKLGRYRLLSCL